MAEEKDKIKEIIDKSGNKFQYEVVNFLRAKGWFVLVSPYYNDNMTDKPREIDIIAEKKFDVMKTPVQNISNALRVQLFIECKYINREVVFWFDEKDMEKSVELVHTRTPLNHPDNVYTKKHHYLRDELVAKLFASNSDKQPDTEPIYKALNQSLNSMVYYQNHATIIPPKEGESLVILYTAKYPLIVCNTFNNFYKVNSASEMPLRIDANFQLEINYAYLDSSKTNKTTYFIIDVIEFKRLSQFLDGPLLTDIGAIQKALTWD